MKALGLFPENYDLTWIYPIDPPRDVWVTWGPEKGQLVTGQDITPRCQVLIGPVSENDTFRLTRAVVTLKEASSSGNITFDLYYSTDNAVTWTAFAVNLTVVAGAKTGSLTAFASDPMDLANGALLRLDCITAGTTTAAEEITVQLFGFINEIF